MAGRPVSGGVASSPTISSRATSSSRCRSHVLTGSQPMRTFRFSDAKSHKFWNIEVSGISFTVTYGKVGAVGQTQTKKFPTADKAQAEADKLIHEKLKKGYVETTARAANSVGEALELALAGEPH